MFNSLYELIYGHRIDLSLRSSSGSETQYRFSNSPGETSYRISGLEEGVYTYTASTILEGKKEQTTGQFSIQSRDIEGQNKTADFALLRQLSSQTGGSFYAENPGEQLMNDLDPAPMAILDQEASFHPLIDWKWLFLILILLITVEWFIRKYSGGY